MRFAPACVVAAIVGGLGACGSSDDAPTGVVKGHGGAAPLPSTSGSAVAVLQAPAKAAATGLFGSHAAMAVGADGRLVVAYFYEDPDGDGDPKDDTLYVARESADGSFGAPISVDATIGGVDHSEDHAYRQIGVATNAGGEIAIAYVKVGDDGSELWLATSAAGSFTKTRLDDPSASHAIADPVVAIVGGGYAIAYVDGASRSGAGDVFFGSGKAGKATFAAVPLLSPEDRLEAATALAVDANGAVGLAYIETPDGVSDTVVYLGATGAPVAVARSQGNGSSSPSVSLAYAGAAPTLSFTVNLEAPPTNDLWVASAPDGSTFAAPIPIPRDHGDVTGLYQALAIDGSGHPAVAAYVVAPSAADPGACGAPKIARTTDGKTFTVCAPAGPRSASGAGRFVSLGTGPDGRLVMTFQDGDGVIGPPGIFLYRE